MIDVQGCHHVFPSNMTNNHIKRQSFWIRMTIQNLWKTSFLNPVKFTMIFIGSLGFEFPSNNSLKKLNNLLILSLIIDNHGQKLLKLNLPTLIFINRIDKCFNFLSIFWQPNRKQQLFQLINTNAPTSFLIQWVEIHLHLLSFIIIKVYQIFFALLCQPLPLIILLQVYVICFYLLSLLRLRWWVIFWDVWMACYHLSHSWVNDVVCWFVLRKLIGCKNWSFWWRFQ